MLCIFRSTIFILSQNFYGSLAAQAWWKLLGGGSREEQSWLD